MAFIQKQDTDGTKATLLKGQLGYDDYTAGGDTGRVYVGNGTINVGLAKETDLDSKQDTLVSGTNIKTINGTTILGSGDITSTPTAVAMSAYLNTHISSGSATPFLWTSDLNQGSFTINPTTGVITVPEDGVYHIVFNGIMVAGGTTGSAVGYIEVDGTNMREFNASAASTTGIDMSSSSVTVSLSAGDTFRIVSRAVYVTTGWYGIDGGTKYTSLDIYKIGA